jgi:hypothetical protein
MPKNNSRNIKHVLSPRERHWVGDGFAVSTIFAPSILDPQELSPFVLMDHALPRHFSPATNRRGVGPHPHRGFETVTFAYQGEVEHRDSHGGGGLIGPGDVQWMTAGSGVVHEEMHSEQFTQTGGTFEMVQLWVNLPARLKMTTPRYQALEGAGFPRLDFHNGSGRLIAGTLQGLTGPAKIHTHMTIFDVKLETGGTCQFSFPAGTTTLVFILEGQAMAQHTRTIRSGDLMVMERKADGEVHLEALSGARVLVLAGEPLDEPVVARGPFVMNTQEEILAAIRDYQQGRMGHLAPGAL